MDGALQSRISPHASPTNRDFSDAKVSPVEDLKAVDGTGGPQSKTAFKDLLMGSNAEMMRTRAAQKNGDLSGAKTDEEFFAALQKQTDGAKIRKPTSELDKDAFLKLFVTQLQNQDPLSPDDSAQMAAQLAQFHGLEQMMNVNKNLEKMSGDQATSRAVGLLDFVGKDVRLEGGKLLFEKGQLTNAVFGVSQDVPKAMLEVRDSAGVVISNQDLGNLRTGEHKLTWDGLDLEGGKVGDGVYTFAVLAKGMNDEPIEVPVTSTVKITGVDLKDKGGSFYTELGKIAVEEVASVGNAGFFKKVMPAAVDRSVTDETTKPLPAKMGAADKAGLTEAIAEELLEGMPFLGAAGVPPVTQAQKMTSGVDEKMVPASPGLPRQGGQPPPATS